jgi:protein SCO1/2
MATPFDSTSPSKPPRRRLPLPALAAIGLLAGLGLVLLIRFLVTGYVFTPPGYNGLVLQSPQPAADFTLTAHTGETVSLSDFRGKAVLIYFGYTFCPDACPATLVELKQMMEQLGRRAEDVQVLMITVDPARDTVEQLAGYVPSFYPSFLGLTGSEEAISAVATNYGIFFEAHEGTPASGYLVDHTTSVMGIDPDGYLRLVYSFGTPPEEIAADMRRLLR